MRKRAHPKKKKTEVSASIQPNIKQSSVLSNMIPNKKRTSFVSEREKTAKPSDMQRNPSVVGDPQMTLVAERGKKRKNILVVIHWFYRWCLSQRNAKILNAQTRPAKWSFRTENQTFLGAGPSAYWNEREVDSVFVLYDLSTSHPRSAQEREGNSSETWTRIP